MHAVFKLGLGHKVCSQFLGALKFHTAQEGFSPRTTLWVIDEMLNRIVVGNARYEKTLMIDPEQERVLGKGWENGFAFFSTHPDRFMNGLTRKYETMMRTLNGDLAPDVCNYAMFIQLISDDDNLARYAYTTAIDAIAFVNNGRDGMVDGYHETPLDQGIHGKELSGTANFKPSKLR